MRFLLEHDVDGEDVCIKINNRILRVRRFIECPCEEGSMAYMSDAYMEDRGCLVIYTCHSCWMEYDELYENI